MDIDKKSMYYSKATNGFYTLEIHSFIPEDAVEITVEQWQALLEAQAEGKVIQSDDNGHPVALEQNMSEAK